MQQPPRVLTMPTVDVMVRTSPPLQSEYPPPCAPISDRLQQAFGAGGRRRWNVIQLQSRRFTSFLLLWFQPALSASCSGVSPSWLSIVILTAGFPRPSSVCADPPRASATGSASTPWCRPAARLPRYPVQRGDVYQHRRYQQFLHKTSLQGDGVSGSRISIHSPDQGMSRSRPPRQA